MITGASSGIGAGVAAAFAKEGAQVVINYPNEQEEENAQSVLNEITEYSDSSTTIKADVSDSGQVTKMIDTVSDQYKRIDILVNNAGIATSAPIHEMTDEMWN